jgi:hypothetical protein
VDAVDGAARLRGPRGDRLQECLAELLRLVVAYPVHLAELVQVGRLLLGHVDQGSIAEDNVGWLAHLLGDVAAQFLEHGEKIGSGG